MWVYHHELFHRDKPVIMYSWSLEGVIRVVVFTFCLTFSQGLVGQTQAEDEPDDARGGTSTAQAHVLHMRSFGVYRKFSSTNCLGIINSG